MGLGFRFSIIRHGTLLSIISILVAACATSGPQTPQPTVKQAVETAPADLQLACAEQVSTQFNSSGTVLPVNSSLARKDVFSVQLTSQSGGFTCEIDRAGTILSIIPSLIQAPTTPAS